MNLCKLLASKKPDLLITFVTEETYTSSGNANFPPNIRFSYLPNNIIPSVESRAADVFSFRRAITTKLGAPFEEILDSFTQTTHPVTTILTDFSLSWAVHAGAHRNIPVAGFWSTTLTEFSMHLSYESLQRKTISDRFGRSKSEIVPKSSEVQYVRNRGLYLKSENPN
ncbi:hypothetical protein Dsin_028828 [Dipteronia sinensis]|uniref:Uncharacterized protein n=1 Tax=Dipteronia sinensis TaxID=43782 RepID=A0AAE0DVX2_9ROSI|nr:hypothetical protein Dsin_028828 [Dipteronia sinensis]